MSMFIMKPYYAKTTDPAHVTTTFATTTESYNIVSNYSNSQDAYFTDNYKSVRLFAYNQTGSTYYLTQPLIRFISLSSFYNMWSTNRTTFYLNGDFYSTRTFTEYYPSQKRTSSGTGFYNSTVYSNTQDYGNIVLRTTSRTADLSTAYLFYRPNYRTATANNILASFAGSRYIGYCELSDPFKVTLVSLENYTTLSRDLYAQQGTMFRATLTELPA